MKQFSISEALSYGWEKMKREFSFVFLVTTILWGVIILSDGIFSFTDAKVADSSIKLAILSILALITLVLTILLQAGYFKIFFELYDDEDVKVSDLYTNYKPFWRLLLGSIIQAIILIVGFVFFIVPGIYFALTFIFSKFLIVDKGLSPIKALRQSALLTKGVKWQLLKLSIILWALNLAGVLLLVGFFVTLPVTMFTMVYVYRHLALKTPEIE